MAEENEAQEAKPQSAKNGGGGGGMLPALLIILLMPVISFAMFKFLFLPEIKKHIPEETADRQEEIDPKKVHVENADKVLVPFPDLIVNISGVQMTRFLRVNFTIESAYPEIEKKVEERMPELTDLATTVLRHLTLADLESPNVMDTVRNQLIQGFDHVLQPPMVDEIYFTQFVVQ